MLCVSPISFMNSQKYKEKVILLEHDIRKNKQIEADLYKELDGALEDLENVTKRWPISCIAI